MHKIRLRSSLLFSALITVLLVGAFEGAVLVASALGLIEFRAVAVAALTALFFLLGAMASSRLLMWLVPLKEGDVKGRGILSHELHCLFHGMVFATVEHAVRSLPLMRLFYQGLGARLGDTSYVAGIIHDPMMVTIGKDCLLGMCCQVVTHVLDGRRRAYYPVRIGDRVTVGPNAVIMPGVVIGDGAVIEAGAVVPRNAVVGPQEIWSGVPARPLTLADLIQRQASAAPKTPAPLHKAA